MNLTVLERVHPGLPRQDVDVRLVAAVVMPAADRVRLGGNGAQPGTVLGERLEATHPGCRGTVRDPAVLEPEDTDAGVVGHSAGRTTTFSQRSPVARRLTNVRANGA